MKKNNYLNYSYGSSSRSTFSTNPRRRRKSRKLFWIILSIILVGLLSFGIYEWKEYRTSHSLRVVGIEYFNEQNYTKAEGQFKQSLQIGGFFSRNLHRDTKYYLAESLYSQNKFQEALDLYKELEEKEEDISANYCFQGACYAKLGNTEAAANQFNKALELGNQESLHYLSKLYYDLEDYNKAIEYEEQYIKINSDQGNSYIILTKGYIENNEYDKAKASLETGLALKNDKEIQQELEFQEVVLYERMLDFDTAYEKCKVYVVSYPEDEAAKLELEFLESR